MKSKTILTLAAVGAGIVALSRFQPAPKGPTWNKPMMEPLANGAVGTAFPIGGRLHAPRAYSKLDQLNEWRPGPKAPGTW